MDHTGPNTALGGVNHGSVSVSYQGSFGSVTSEPLVPTAAITTIQNSSVDSLRRGATSMSRSDKCDRITCMTAPI